MKILIACIDFIPQNLKRQPWYYMNLIAQDLSKKGHEVWILTNKESDQSKISYPIIMKNFRSFPVGVDKKIIPLIKKKGFDSIIWNVGLTDFFFKRKIDSLELSVIGVVTSPLYNLTELLVLEKELFTNWQYINQFFLGAILTRKRVNKFLSQPNLKALVFQSNATRKRYIPFSLEEDKTFIVPPAVSEDFHSLIEEAKKSSNRKENKDYFRVLYAGPPLTFRGLDTLIKAITIARKKIENIELLILSRLESDDLIYQQKKIQLLIKKSDLENNTKIISGVLSSFEIAQCFFSANIICLPFKCVISDFPITVIEALVADKPLITTFVPGLPELAEEDRCFIVPPNNSKAIVKIIFKIYGKSTLSEKRSFQPLDKHSLAQRKIGQVGEAFDNILSRVIP